MALEMNDLMMLRSLDKDSMTPYEQFKTQHMQAKSHVSGLGIAGLTVGVGAVVLAIGAGAWAGSRAQNAKDVAIAKNEGLKDLVATLASTLAAERGERIAGDINLTATINDSVSGQQSGQLTAMQQAELNASQIATQTVMTGLMTGKYSENPQKVALYRDATPCPCPAGGCGCGM